MSAETFAPRENNSRLKGMFSPLSLPTYDKYISLNYLKFLVACIIMVLGLVILIDCLDNFDEFYKYANINDKSFFQMLWILTKHYGAYAPSLVIQHMFSALPVVAGIIAVTNSTLIESSRWLRASGISLQRTILPLLVVALIISTVFYLYSRYVRTKFTSKKLCNEQPLKTCRNDPLKIVLNDGDTIQFIEMGHYDGESGQAYNIRIEVRQLEDFLEGKNIFHAYRAKRASLQPYIDVSNPDDEHLNKWTAEDGASILVQMNNNRVIKKWDNSLPTLVTQAMLERQVLTEKVMTWDDLMRLDTDLEVRLEIHNRLSEPLLSVAMMLVSLAVILKLTSSGQEASYISNAIIGIVSCAVFFMLRSIFFSMGESSILLPVIAAQGPTLIYLILGTFLLTRVEH